MTRLLPAVMARVLAACTPMRSPDAGRSGETVGARAGGTEQSAPAAFSPRAPGERQTYTRDEILISAKGFFGGNTSQLAGLIEQAFAGHGEPVAYIEGEEGAGAFVVGLRYGQGYLQHSAAVVARRSGGSHPSASTTAATPARCSRSSTTCARPNSCLNGITVSRAAFMSWPGLVSTTSAATRLCWRPSALALV